MILYLEVIISSYIHITFLDVSNVLDLIGGIEHFMFPFVYTV